MRLSSPMCEVGKSYFLSGMERKQENWETNTHTYEDI